MSLGVEVSEESSMAEIGEAKRLNGAMQLEAEVAETSVMTEQKQFEGYTNLESQYGQGADSLFSRANTAGADLTKSPGSNRASVYGDVALEGVGLGAAGQMASMLKGVVTDYQNPFKHGSANTFEDVISGRATNKAETSATDILGKKVKGARSIRTEHFNDLVASEKGIRDFTTSGVKGVKASETKFAEFSRRRELSVTAKMVNAEKLQIANAMEAKVGAKIAKAQQFGIAPSLVKELHMKNGPSTEMLAPEVTAVTDSGDDSWMGA